MVFVSLVDIAGQIIKLAFFLTEALLMDVVFERVLFNQIRTVCRVFKGCVVAVVVYLG